MNVFTPSDELTELDPAKRVRYSPGMIIGDDELRQDQRYLTARDNRHQRALHGWGVVSGLEVVVEEGRVKVLPGAAIDATGRWICVEVTQCADLLAWLNERGSDLPDDLSGGVHVWVTLCYDECATDLIPVPSGPCRTLENSLAPSRVKDSFRLELALQQPPSRGDLVEIDQTGQTNVMTELLRDDATLDEKRDAVSAFVSLRGAPEGFANRCLDSLAPGCVVLGRVTVPLKKEPDQQLEFSNDLYEDWIDLTDRPLVLSTQFLQEWLLRLKNGGAINQNPTPVPFPLNDLTDVEAPTAGKGMIIVGTGKKGANGAWIEQRPKLGLLDDVEIPPGFGSDSSHAGQVLTFDAQKKKWTPRADEVADPGPAENYVRCRPTPYAIVAGGVVELEFKDDVFRLRDLSTQYGKLDVSLFALDGFGALLLLRFPGYRETFKAFPANMLVKLTPEADNWIVHAQVTKLSEDGIIVLVTPQVGMVSVESYRSLVKPWIRDFDDIRIALHVEISVFDDRTVGNDPIREIKVLTEDV